MIEEGAIINHTVLYYCSYCGEYLFEAGLFEEPRKEAGWNYCPFCGTPLYREGKT